MKSAIASDGGISLDTYTLKNTFLSFFVAFGITRDRLPSVIHTATYSIYFRTPCSTHNT